MQRTEPLMVCGVPQIKFHSLLARHRLQSLSALSTNRSHFGWEYALKRRPKIYDCDDWAMMRTWADRIHQPHTAFRFLLAHRWTYQRHLCVYVYWARSLIIFIYIYKNEKNCDAAFLSCTKSAFDIATHVACTLYVHKRLKSGYETKKSATSCPVDFLSLLPAYTCIDANSRDSIVRHKWQSCTNGPTFIFKCLKAHGLPLSKTNG